MVGDDDVFVEEEAAEGNDNGSTGKWWRVLVVRAMSTAG
jgi:hypothetical protein